MEDLIFSVEAHSGKELRHFKFISVSFMAQLLGSASFIGKVNHVLANTHYPVFTSLHVSVILTAIVVLIFRTTPNQIILRPNTDIYQLAGTKNQIFWVFFTIFSAEVRNKTKTTATTMKHLFNSLLLSLRDCLSKSQINIGTNGDFNN